jgi:hypothetical protein
MSAVVPATRNLAYSFILNPNKNSHVSLLHLFFYFGLVLETMDFNMNIFILVPISLKVESGIEI